MHSYSGIVIILSYSQQIKNISIYHSIIWQVHQRNVSKSCIDGARGENSTHYYDLYNFTPTKEDATHTSYSSKYTLLTALVHANNYCINPKQKQLPFSKRTFPERNKNKSL